MLHRELHKLNPLRRGDVSWTVWIVTGEVVVACWGGGLDICPTLERMQTRGGGKGAGGQRSIAGVLSFTCPWWQEEGCQIGRALRSAAAGASSGAPCKAAESGECGTISSSPTRLSMFRYTHRGLALRKQCMFLLNLARLSCTLLSLRQWFSAPQGLQRWVGFFPLHFLLFLPFTQNCNKLGMWGSSYLINMLDRRCQVAYRGEYIGTCVTCF